MGRPKSENPKDTQITVRLDGETLRKLDTVAEKEDKSRVQVIRMGIEQLYEGANDKK